MADINEILAAKLLTMADDELVLAHRNSEWCGHAPILEEDIAFANLALDELGHAMLWYRLVAELIGKDPEREPDRLVYFREPFEFRASQFAALPKGDWAFTMLRQYLWDVWEWVRLEMLAGCSYGPVAETAAKIATEEIYHLRHTQAWVRRLGLGTAESAARMTAALELLWPYTGQLTDRVAGEEVLQSIGFPDSALMAAAWRKRVGEHLAESGLTIPDVPILTLDRSLQSVHMVEILAELQQVARLDPVAEW